MVGNVDLDAFHLQFNGRIFVFLITIRLWRWYRIHILACDRSPSWVLNMSLDSLHIWRFQTVLLQAVNICCCFCLQLTYINCTCILIEEKAKHLLLQHMVYSNYRPRHGQVVCACGSLNIPLASEQHYLSLNPLVGPSALHIKQKKPNLEDIVTE